MTKINFKFYLGLRVGLLLAVLLPMITSTYAVVGAVEIITSNNGQPYPEVKITLFQEDEIVTEEKTDGGGVVLIPLEEGDYTIVIDSSTGTLKDTVTVGAGQLVSVTGDVARNSITQNSQALNRHRPISTDDASRGYEISLADMGGLLSYKFTTPQGSIYLGFPYYAVVGETISFSAILLPNGTDAKETAKNMKKLSEYSILIDDQKYSIEKARLWQIRARAKSNVGLVSGRGKKPLISVRADFRLQPWPEAATIDSGSDSTYFANAGWPICIHGKFDGKASNTRLYYGDSQMEIIAETSSSIAFSPPGNLTGLHSVRVVEGGNTFTSFMRNISMILSADSYEMWKGESTKLHLKILGLEGFQKTAYVSLVNLTTGVISMSGGNSQFFIITPGNVGEGGVVSYERDLNGIKRGNFNINAIMITK